MQELLLDALYRAVWVSGGSLIAAALWDGVIRFWDTALYVQTLSEVLSTP